MSDKHEHYGHRSRLRDRASKEGLQNFLDYQVIEYLLSFIIPYKDTNPLAHALIAKYGSLGAVLNTDENELKKIKGLGSVSAHFLSHLREVFNYYELEKAHTQKKISSANETYAFFKKLFAGKLYEELYAVCLSSKNQIVKVAKISEGTSNEANVNIRKISDVIHQAKVSNVIIGHNHPQGTSTPSNDDNQFTKALVMALTLNSITLLDHIIIGADGSYYSYKNNGVIDENIETLPNFFHHKIKIADSTAIYEVD